MYNFEYAYLDMMRYILDYGDIRETRNSVTKSVFGLNLRIDSLREGQFPLITTRKMFTKGILGEYAAFLREPKHVEDFKKWGCNYWGAWADADGSLRLDYGRGWAEQFDHVVRSLRAGGSDRRMLVNSWLPENLADLSLPCCHYSYQFYRSGDHVDLLWNQRSADWAIGVPSDIVLAGTMLVHVARAAGLSPGSIIMQFGDCHLYKDHWADAEMQIDREIKDLPSYYYVPRQEFTDWEPTDLTFINYFFHPAIKYKLTA